MWLPQRCEWTPLIQRLLWAGHFHEFPPWTHHCVLLGPSHGRAVPLLTMNEAQDYCNQNPKCVPIKKIWMIAINSTFLWINIMCLCQNTLACSQKLTVTHKSISPVAQQTISLCRPLFTEERGFFSVSQSAPSKVFAPHLYVNLWVTKCTQSYWCQGSPVPALGFHQPLIWNKFISKSCPTISQEWCHSTGVNDQRISPLSCSQTQQSRCAVSISDTTAMLNHPSCSPCGTARKELSSVISDLG